MASTVLLVGKGATLTDTVTTAAGTTQASGSGFVVFFNNGGQSVTSVTDNKSNTYTKRGSTQNSIECWAALPGDSGYSGGGSSHTCTIVFGGTAFPTAHLIEATSLLATGSFDQVVGNVDASSPWTVTTATLAQADSVALSGMEVNANPPGNYLSGGGFTLLSEEPDWNNYFTSAASGVVVASTSALTPSWTVANGHPSSSAGVICLVLKSSTAPPAASVKPAWAGLYGRGGGRDLVRMHGLAIQSKNLGLIGVNALFGAAGGGGLNGTVAETLTLADTPNATNIVTRAVAETLTLVDTPNATNVVTRAVVEALTLADTTDASRVFAGSVQETLALVDTPNATSVKPGSVAEALALTDTINAASTLAAAVAEAVSLTDTSNAATVTAGSVAEAIALSDTPDATVTGGGSINGAVDETLALSDSQNALSNLTRAVVETLALTDAQNSTSAATRAVIEAMALSDTSNAASVQAAAVAEVLALLDTTDATITSGIVAGLVIESFGLTDTQDATGGQVENVFGGGFFARARALAKAREDADREAERVESAALAQQAAQDAIQRARDSAQRINIRTELELARADLARANLELNQTLLLLIQAALAEQANNRLAELEEEELAAQMLLMLATDVFG